MNKIIIIFIVVIVFCFPNNSLPDCGDTYCSGTTCTAVDATYAEVNGAVQEARLCSGDITVNIPTDTKTWGNDQSMIVNLATATATSITINGAGKTKTIITNNIQTSATCGSTSNALFNITGGPGKKLTISGIGFVQGSCVNGNSPTIMIYLTGDNFVDWRIHNNDFTGTERVYSVWSFGAAQSGLIDNNTHYYGKPLVYGATSNWATDTDLGGESFVFIENNSFDKATFANAMDANYGGKFVSRYNNYINGELYIHGANTTLRGGRAFEIYNNNFTAKIDLSVAGFLRGGTGVVYNNRWLEDGASWTGTTILLDNLRSCAVTNPCNAENADGFDVNTNPNPASGVQDGWPCRDQIGRGKDQASEPVYGWNNFLGATSIDFVVNPTPGETCDAMEDHVVANRDFYNASSLSDAKSKGLIATYAAYECPHRLAGLTGASCDSSISGRDGYGLYTASHRGLSIGGGVSLR